MIAPFPMFILIIFNRDGLDGVFQNFPYHALVKKPNKLKAINALI